MIMLFVTDTRGVRWGIPRDKSRRLSNRRNEFGGSSNV